MVSKIDKMNSGFTCITCRLLFDTNDLQKSHYQSDWHRYNLKRQAVEMPPISQDEYDHKVAVFNAPKQTAAPSSSFYCSTCKKGFQTQNSFLSHNKSSKHLEVLTRGPKGPKQPRKKDTNGSTPSLANSNASKLEENMDTDEAVEGKKQEENVDTVEATEEKKLKELPLIEGEEEEDDSDSDEWHSDHGTDEDDEDIDLHEEQALPVTSCLFCPRSSSALDSSIEHMRLHHDFAIPDEKFCIDVPGLIAYLCLKVGAGRMCLLCPERRSSFANVEACQMHMRDKQHCRIASDLESLIELIDFYDYDALYDEMTANEPGVEDDRGMLTLPSGASIGHRSLHRFYKQNLRSSDVSGAGRSRAAIEKAKGIYSALAWTGCSGVVAHKAAKDLQFMARVRRRFELRVGLKSNKLFQSRGRSDQ